MELAIAKAIVHVLDPAGGAPVFSDRLLELEGETRDYLAGHLERHIIAMRAKPAPSWRSPRFRRCCWRRRILCRPPSGSHSSFSM